jgi:hypothetical protein
VAENELSADVEGGKAMKTGRRREEKSIRKRKREINMMEKRYINYIQKGQKQRGKEMSEK